MLNEFFKLDDSWKNIKAIYFMGGQTFAVSAAALVMTMTKRFLLELDALSFMRLFIFFRYCCIIRHNGNISKS